MARLGKKTLYLDLDALDRLQAALERLPGRPSVSSYLSEQLPTLADSMETMVNALEGRGLRGLADLLALTVAKEEASKTEVAQLLAESKHPEKPLPQMIADSGVPPKKPRKSRSKKVAEG